MKTLHLVEQTSLHLACEKLHKLGFDVFGTLQMVILETLPE